MIQSRELLFLVKVLFDSENINLVSKMVVTDYGRKRGKHLTVNCIQNIRLADVKGPEVVHVPTSL